MDEDDCETPLSDVIPKVNDDSVMINDASVVGNTLCLSPTKCNPTNLDENHLSLSSTQSTAVDSNGDGKVVPLKVGMKFETWEEIEEHYKMYAYQEGFGVSRVASSYRANKMRRSVTWRCACYGKPKIKTRQSDKQMKLGEGLEKLVTTKSKKCCCPAMIYASLNSDSLWELSKVINEHENHILSPSKSKWENLFIKPNKRRVVSNYNVDVRSAKSFACLAMECDGWDNVPITQKDAYTHLSEVKRLKMTNDDTKAMNEYFERIQAHNENFFYAYRCDGNGSFTDVIWVDARSRVAYQEFGDVVYFDTTYLTNNYDLPFVNFVGVNHHGQSLLFGCALISYENCETFEWLFRQWLFCMAGVAPGAILTLQVAAMRKPLRDVMPQTKHRWCIWHIMQKFERKLGNYLSYDQLNDDLKQVIFDSFTVEEFENRWAETVKDNNVESDEWLQELFKESEMWAPVYLRHIFWAGMMSMHRLESINSFFDGFVNSKTRLYEFATCYSLAMSKSVEDEKEADALSDIRHGSLCTGYVVEKFFQKIYTKAKFREVQVQCEKVTYCNSREQRIISTNEVLHVIEDRVWIVPKGSFNEVVTQNKRLFHIIFNYETKMMDCECKLFVTHGIMCRHMIRLLDLYDAHTVPDKYILRRWRRDIPRKHTRVRVPYYHPYDPHDTVEGKRRHKMRLFFEPICDDAKDGDDTVDIVISMLKELHLKVKEVKKKRSCTSTL